MNIVLTPEQLAGLAYGTSKRNTVNPNAKPMTDAEYAADILGVKCDEFAAEQGAALLSMMKPVGAEIAIAAGGDPIKIASALEAGRLAAIASLK